ncbi:hypothetical protein [Cellulomonas sp. S1-8]|uniref:hypothetical protein n=1 Tax=Cellulomonas sp. S1-8 TaxID=2904790 RepID=UPI002243C7E9|nr:hypothetical protein [Cellulomonas sp. S1-8]UZN03772.1 hypothetical protein OKX07_02190 [Cellulomonas sp. S1-8]
MWIGVLADEVQQENGRAAGQGATVLGWHVVAATGVLPVLGLAAVTVGAVALVRRSRVPTWPVPAVARVTEADVRRSSPGAPEV